MSLSLLGGLLDQRRHFEASRAGKKVSQSNSCSISVRWMAQHSGEAIASLYTYA